MFTTFIHILKHSKNIIALVFGSFITFTILRILPVFEILKNSYKIPGIGITRKFELFWDYSFLSFFNISISCISAIYFDHAKYYSFYYLCPTSTADVIKEKFCRKSFGDVFWAIWSWLLIMRRFNSCSVGYFSWLRCASG
jgi:hypothetical protein